MKKLLYILLAGCFLLLWACSSSFSASEAEEESAAPQEESSENASGFSKAYASSGKQPKIYTNQELGFSFTIPQEWPSDEYKIVVSHGEQDEDDSAYSQIDFIFRNNKENPLLRIYVVTSQWWGEYGSAYDSSLIHYLGKTGDTAYCYVLPVSRVYVDYAEESTAAAYAAMVIDSSTVESSFSILTETSVSSAASVP